MANTHPKCSGCRHQKDTYTNGWCYMFQNPPVDLPCGQHDMFEDLRRENGKRFLKEQGIK